MVTQKEVEGAVPEGRTVIGTGRALARTCLIYSVKFMDSFMQFFSTTFRELTTSRFFSKKASDLATALTNRILEDACKFSIRVLRCF